MLLSVKKMVLAVAIVAVTSQVSAKPVLLTAAHNIYEYQLDNGFRVILAPNNKENKVYLDTIYLTGALNDPQGKGGLAHLLEHLAFKGTKNIPGIEFQRRLDQYTLMNNASTSYYVTKYTNIVRPEPQALNNILQLEAERMDKLVLQEQFVPTEIEIVRREREMRLDQPFSVLIDQVFKAAYGNQFLGRLAIGDLDELKSIKMPELEQFYRDYYAPNNAVMVMAGKFEPEVVIAEIEKNFASIAARPIAQSVTVPTLAAEQIQPKKFQVEKGSDWAKFNIYLHAKDEEIRPTLALIPYLYTMQPSGQLYQNMVQKGISTNVAAMTWLERDFNLAFLGAIYAPSQDAAQVEQTLTTQLESKRDFSEAELQRVKNLFRNEQRKMLTDSVRVGSTLSDYVTGQAGDWTVFFKEQDAVQQLSVDVLNNHLQQFLQAAFRVRADILPTAEQTQQIASLPQAINASEQTNISAVTATEQPLKDSKTYQKEVKQFVQQAAQLAGAAEEKIVRGRFDNGMQYALLPTSTRDERTYATIEIDFGDAKSLMHQEQVMDIMTYLLLRGSDKQSLQDITDHSIALDGVAKTSRQGNTIFVQLNAPQENFAEYFTYIVKLLKQPKFDVTEFDLIKAQSLQQLDRPYTEPDVVAGLTLARLTEQYPIGDLRYHFEPKVVQQQLSQVSQKDVQGFYQRYFAMNHARVAVTGDFVTKTMRKNLKKSFAHWSNTQKYQVVAPVYKQFGAQKHHVWAEPREFGYYQSVLTLPVGVYHSDAAALSVFAHILGESQLSSRLAKELREKHALVYGFSSQLSLDAHNDVGSLQIGANYTAGQAAQLSQAVHSVFNDLLKNGVTEQELEAAKADIMKQRATLLEDERNLHRMLNGQLELNKTMANRVQRDLDIAKLSTKDIHIVIKKYLKPAQLVEVMADQYGQKQP